MWDIVGHEGTLNLLFQSLKQHRLPHSYLFVGPPQVGKYTTAIALAQALNCSEDSPDMRCGKCNQCERISSGLHPDVQIITINKNISTIAFEEITDLQRNAHLMPYEGKYKVYIFPEADQLTVESSNALLKMLEEPPDSVIFMLLTSRPERLIPTIVSRSQRIDFTPVSVDAITLKLQEIDNLSPTRAREIAIYSNGRVGWAIQAATNPDILATYIASIEEITEIIEGGTDTRLAFSERFGTSFYSDRDASISHLNNMVQWWRYMLLIKESDEQLWRQIPAKPSIQRCASWISSRDAIEAIKMTQQTVLSLGKNANPRLAVDVLMLSLPAKKKSGQRFP